MTENKNQPENDKGKKSSDRQTSVTFFFLFSCLQSSVQDVENDDADSIVYYAHFWKYVRSSNYQLTANI